MFSNKYGLFPMKLTNLTIKDLLNENRKLTFLVGAGCSVDPPSCLPAGRQMMEAIIKYTCAESEIKKILELEDMRFEQLIEIMRDQLDPDLRIIDYYGEYDRPNLQHFFLAEMIKKGHFVLTTNFDFLIEYALLQLGIDKEDIIPVITQEDFKKFKDPYELRSQGKKLLYKIHGSTKNIITEERTRKSLIATIQAFGANKEGKNVFQLESFKQPAFSNLTKDRSLVVMGYSGSDDFDIVPTLKILKHIKNIIWINYKNDDGGKELIYEIEIKDTENYENLEKLDQILVDINRMKYANRVLRVDVNTTRMIEKLNITKTKISSDPFPIDIDEWLINNIQPPDKFIKLHIPCSVYFDFNMYEEALLILEDILNIAENTNNQVWKAASLSNIGQIYNIKGDHPKALKLYKDALQISEQLGDLKIKAILISNIGMIYENQGDYSKALKLYEEALQIDEKLDYLTRMSVRFTNIGSIYDLQGENLKALKFYDMALKIDEKLGDLNGKANSLNNLGLIYKVQGNYTKALKRFEEALQIYEQLGDLSGKASNLNNIGEVHRTKGEYKMALKRYEETLQIYKQLGELPKKAIVLNNLGLIYGAQENYSKALIYFEESLKITENCSMKYEKASTLNNIGGIYDAQGNYQEALKLYNKALQIDEQLGNLDGEANSLNNIGQIYFKQANYSEAMKYVKESLRISEQLGDLYKKAGGLGGIGTIYGMMKNYVKAFKYLGYALEIYKDLKLENEIRQVYRVMSDLKSNIKIGRNQSCYCGSGKKYKNCHWREDHLS